MGAVRGFDEEQSVPITESGSAAGSSSWVWDGMPTANAFWTHEKPRKCV